jgi:hypothetical protein
MLFASHKKQGDNCDLFTAVEVSLSYFSGNKALSNDFLKNLTTSERKMLKRSKDFIVEFYLTKQGIVSDPSITPSDLPEEIKRIVEKGFSTMINWRPAIRNGWKIDTEFSLKKSTLLNY